MLPEKNRDPGRTASDNRLFVEAVLRIARTGTLWWDLPSELVLGTVSTSALPVGRDGAYGTESSPSWHKRLILKEPLSIGRLCVPISTPPEQQKSGEQPLGRSRGRLSAKIHPLIEGLGSLARFCLTGGQAGDSFQALPLLEGVQPSTLSADKAYDTDSILAYCTAEQIEAVIPPRSHRLVQRPFDKHKYESRNLIKCFFCCIKHFRRITTRYDKLANRFASFVALAVALIWLT